MDDRIRKALRKLGLSEEAIENFASLVVNVKGRVRDEGLITRKKDDLPAKRRKLIVKYQPKGTRSTVSYASRAKATLRALDKSQTPLQKPAGAPPQALPERRLLEPGPDAPEWQKSRYRFSQRIRRLTGKTGDQAAADTMRTVDAIGPIKRR